MQYMKYLFALVVLALLTACGGGGGSAGTVTGSSAPSTATGTPTLVVDMRDAAGASTNSVSGAGATTARATLKDANGLPAAGVLVKFSGDATLIKLTPTSGQVLTDANGVAAIQVAPASLTASGAGTLNVTASVGGTSLAKAFDFQMSSAGVSLQTLDVGTGSLAAFGNRPISVIAAINGAPAANTPIQVTFAASCGLVNPATVTTDSNGRAATTYSANSAACAGTNVTLSASTPGAVPLSGVISVQAPQATNIQFVSATPQLIFLAGSVGPTQSQLVFKVVDAVGTALQNQSVQLSLVNTGPGVSLNTVGNTQPVTMTSDATGAVSLAVFSGTVPTSVQVRAVLTANNSVFANSNVLTVASGRPVQRAASLSISKFAIEGFNVDGPVSDFTMSLADRQGNPVPDGTQVNFVAEAGVMVPAVCVISGGSSSCKVQIRAQGTRPANGIVSVLAYVPGEEDFVDANFNNVYDLGESFTDMGNAFRDDNDNAVFDTGEFSVPRTGAVTCGGSTNGRPNTCDGVWGAVDVRAQANIVFSTSGANITGSLTNVVVGTSTLGSLDVTVSDLNGNSMPTGSNIGIQVISANNSGCTAVLPSAVIPNTRLPFRQTVSTSKCINGDRIVITVTSPLGTLSSQGFTVP
ncbi:MAG: hypothetical protein HYX47_07995 [Burkholderiales bacterium]|nr:hypothetical protein [Burkholderiales bacterium]